jgi:hypothetical protein
MVDPTRTNVPSEEEIEQQRKLLAAHRQSLAIYLEQRALHGTAYAPPSVIHGIHNARKGIQQAKATLRKWNIEVDDQPDDVESPEEVRVQQIRRAGFAIILVLLAGFTIYVGSRVWSSVVSIPRSAPNRQVAEGLNNTNTSNMIVGTATLSSPPRTPTRIPSTATPTLLPPTSTLTPLPPTETPTQEPTPTATLEPTPTPTPSVAEPVSIIEQNAETLVAGLTVRVDRADVIRVTDQGSLLRFHFTVTNNTGDNLSLSGLQAVDEIGRTYTQAPEVPVGFPKYDESAAYEWPGTFPNGQTLVGSITLGKPVPADVATLRLNILTVFGTSAQELRNGISISGVRTK